MTEINQDTMMYAGDDKVIQFTNVDVKEDGTKGPLDLTGATMEWVMRRSNGGTIKLRKVTDYGIVATSPTSGILAVVLEAVDTESLEAGQYFHGLAMEKNGEYSTLATGKLELLSKVRQ